MSAPVPASSVRHTVIAVAIAFLLGFLFVAVGVSQTRFLWGAWLHAGF